MILVGREWVDNIPTFEKEAIPKNHYETITYKESRFI